MHVNEKRKYWEIEHSAQLFTILALVFMPKVKMEVSEATAILFPSHIYYAFKEFSTEKAISVQKRERDRVSV